MPKQDQNPYLRFTAIAMQMGVIIAAGTYGGVWLDEKYSDGGNLYTVILSLTSVFASLYHVYREIIKISNEK
jgi:hypothetical protein